MKRLFLSLFLAALIMLPAYFGYAVLDDETIVLYLSFDEGTGKEAKDQSKYGNHGEIVENTEWVKPGKLGKAAIEITDKTANAVVIPAADSLNIEGEITMMAWMNPTAWSGEGHGQLIDKGCHNGIQNSSYGLDLGGAGSTIKLILGTGNARPTPEVPAALELNKWQHVAGTYDGKTLKGYLDGELVGEKGEAIDFKATTAYEVRIGSAKDRQQYGYVGAIDEVAIFSRALGENEIKKFMGGITAVSPKGKLATTWSTIKNQ